MDKSRKMDLSVGILNIISVTAMTTTAAIVGLDNSTDILITILVIVTNTILATNFLRSALDG